VETCRHGMLLAWRKIGHGRSHGLEKFHGPFESDFPLAGRVRYHESGVMPAPLIADPFGGQ